MRSGAFSAKAVKNLRVAGSATLNALQITGNAVLRALRLFGNACLKPFWKWLRRVFVKDSAPNLVLVTTLIVIVAAAGLGVLHNVTYEKIEAAREASFEAAMATVFPEEESLMFTRSELGENIYEWYNAEGELTGFAVRISLRGLGGPVHMAVGINTLWEVTGVTVVSHRETGDLSEFKERAAAEALAAFEWEVRQ
jgi:hypothetical protein